MSVGTIGKIKGFVKHEDILDFLREKYDADAYSDVKKYINCPLSKCVFEYAINEHSVDNENWYAIYGSISFKYHEENRMLFYSYNNINTYEKLEYYSQYNLSDMVEAETTYISLGCFGSSVEIISEIISHFGGGWIDENDCDDKEYYPIF